MLSFEFLIEENIFYIQIHVYCSEFRNYEIC